MDGIFHPFVLNVQMLAFFPTYPYIRKSIHHPALPSPSTTKTHSALRYHHDPLGQRIEKRYYLSWAVPEQRNITYYVRDAQGNVMATYSREVDEWMPTYNYRLADWTLYGSSRLGLVKGTEFGTLGSVSGAEWQVTLSFVKNRVKQYELTNHLGNVLAIVSGEKDYLDTTGTGTWSYSIGRVLNAQDYYPFGSIMPGRNFNSSDYRYGAANGQEKVDEISGSGNHYTAEYWEYDSRLGRRWEKDPVVKHHESPYACYANNPIWFIDPMGADTGDVVVAFGGGDFKGEKDAGDVAPDIIKQMQEQHLNKEGGKGQAFYSQYWGTDPEDKKSLDNATQAAYDFILGNYNKDAEGNDIKGGRILIYGYSYGGVMATHLSDRLKSAGLSVDVLYTVDAAAGPETDEVDRTIGSNVKSNLNYYQTKSSGPFGLVGSHGAANSRDDGTKKGIFQTQLKSVEHSNIDDFTKQFVIRSMLGRLNTKPIRK
jgi:RHS repeat-associated protein